MKKQIVVRTHKLGYDDLVNKLNEGYTIVTSNSTGFGVEYVLEKEVEDIPENSGKDGKWIMTIGRRNDGGMDLECSECGHRFGTRKLKVTREIVNYCSCCGAKMKNVEDIAIF